MTKVTIVGLSEFRKKLETLINCESKENGSDTPDFILAQYLTDCLAAFDTATRTRDKWYGFNPWSYAPQSELANDQK